jgi:hypothetical protein
MNKLAEDTDDNLFRFCELSAKIYCCSDGNQSARGAFITGAAIHFTFTSLTLAYDLRGTADSIGRTALA